MSVQTFPYESGSNQGAAKILLTLVLGSLAIGGVWSSLGPRSRVTGTWVQQDGSSFEIFHLDADGTYWHRTLGGFLSVNLTGTYQMVGSSGGTYRLRMKTEIGEYDMEARLELPDRLLLIDKDDPESPSAYTRTGDWVLAVRPSKSPTAYDGAKPHLGCWQVPGNERPALELLDGEKLLLYSGDETERAVYSVDYSKIPFQLDVTLGDGRVEREIFEFAADQSLRISREHRTDGQRPKKMTSYQQYVPCTRRDESDSQGDDHAQ